MELVNFKIKYDYVFDINFEDATIGIVDIFTYSLLITLISLNYI